MTSQGAIFEILFLGLFNVIGGLALGHGLRGLVAERTLRDGFFIIWGAGFGGIPLIISLCTLLGTRSGPLFLVNPLLFLSAIVLNMTIVPELVRDIGAGTLVAIGVGAMFMFIGVGIGMTVFSKGSLAFALTVGGLFVLGGGLAFALGINALIRGKQTT